MSSSDFSVEELLRKLQIVAEEPGVDYHRLDDASDEKREQGSRKFGPRTDSERAALWGGESEWEESLETYSPGQIYVFLNASYVTQMLDKLQIKNETCRTCAIRSLTMFDERPEFQYLLWHCYRLMWKHEHHIVPPPDTMQCPAGKLVENWPNISRDAHEFADMFYFFPLIASIPKLLELNTKIRGIPESYTVDTLDDVERWMLQNSRIRGLPGFRRGHLEWLVNHLRGDLFRLGRLQYHMLQWSFGHVGYEHKSTKQVVFLANPNLNYDENGESLTFYRAMDKKRAANAPKWKPVNELDKYFTSGREDGESFETARGFAIDPLTGGARRDVILELPLTEWDCFVKDGDYCLMMHIPEGPALTAAACLDSLKQSEIFFAKYFKSVRFKVYFTESWLLDPMLCECLPESNNIPKFIRNWYLLPRPNTNDIQSMERVFDRWDSPIFSDRAFASLPQQTTLQRAVLSVLKEQVESAEKEEEGQVPHKKRMHFREGLGIFRGPAADTWGKNFYQHSDWIERLRPLCTVTEACPW